MINISHINETVLKNIVMGLECLTSGDYSFDHFYIPNRKGDNYLKMVKGRAGTVTIYDKSQGVICGGMLAYKAYKLGMLWHSNAIATSVLVKK